MAKFIKTYDEWEDIINYEHKHGNRIGLFAENDTIYDKYGIDVLDRVNDVLKNTNKIAQLYIVNYSILAEMPKEWLSTVPLYVKKTHMSAEDVFQLRKKYIDYFFCMPNLKYKKEVMLWIYENMFRIPILKEVDTISLLRGCLGASVYINANFKYKIDYISICPFRFNFVFVIKHFLSLYGINSGFPENFNYEL